MKINPLFCFLIPVLLSGGALRQIHEDADVGRISSADALVYENLLARAPHLLPQAYRSDAQESVKCGFGARALLENIYDTLSDDQQALLEPALFRPSYPYTYISPRGLFCMHYTDEGSAAVPADDLDNSGVPDFVEEGGLAMDLAYTVIVDQMGYHPPLQDTGGTPQWDVYFTDYNGYGETVLEQIVTFSPMTYRAYILMDNDFQETSTRGLDGLRVTCAHEFFHMVQLAYQYRDSDVFIMEAAATWMEDVVYDDINDYLQYLPAVLGTDNTPFSRRNGVHEYGLAIWFHFLQKRYGPDIVRSFWEALIDAPAYSACDQVLGRLETTFSDEMSIFYGWNLATGSRADTLHYYPEGHLYPSQYISETLTLSGTQVFRRSVHMTGCRYFQTAARGQTLIWAMVNAAWYASATISDGLLQIQQGQAEPWFNEVTDSVFSTLISDAGGWRTAVYVQSEGESATLAVYPEFTESMFGSIAGVVKKYGHENGVLIMQGGLADVVLNCTGAGSDGLIETNDDTHYTPQATNAEGLYQFFGLTPGLYQITLDPFSVTHPWVPMDTDSVYTLEIAENLHITNADYAFKRVGPDFLPVSIPSPFVPAEWAEVKLPFLLDEPDWVTLTIFTSSGMRIYQDQAAFNPDKGAYFTWNGRRDGTPVPSGVYVYTITGSRKLLRREKIAVIH